MRPYFAALAIICCLLTDTIPATAQSGTSVLDGYTLKNIRRRVFSPFIVSQGKYLWYGTDAGLFRRDSETGAERRFTTADGLPSNNVKCAAVAPDGTVWIGTAGGVGRYDGNTWKKYTMADGLAGNDVISIAAAPNGDIWAGVSVTSGEICRFDGKSWKIYSGSDGFTAPGASRPRSGQAIAFGTDGSVWTVMTWTVGSFLEGYYPVSALLRFDGAKWSHRSTVQRRDFAALAVGKDGTVWAGSTATIGSEPGLLRFDGASWTEDIYALPREAGPTRLRFGPDGTLWACVPEYNNWENNIPAFGGCLFRAGSPAWKNYSYDQGLASNTAYDAAFGPDGTVWAVTSLGVCCQKGDSWEIIAGIEGPVSNAVTSLAVDARRTLWAGSTEGISGFDGNTWRAHEQERVKNVNCIGADTAGAVWAGLGEAKGLWRYNGSDWDRIGPEDGLKLSPSYEARALAFAPGNQMVASVYDPEPDASAPWKMAFQYPGSWLVSASGAGEIIAFASTPSGAFWYASQYHLYRYENGESLIYSPGTDLPGTRIRALAVAPDGRIWAGTDQGAAVFDRSEWKQYSPGSGLAGKDVRVISFDLSGRVWMGTESGVSVLDGETWKRLTAAEGLADNRVAAIAFHPDGTVWIGTENGITRLTPGTVSVESGEAAPEPFAIRGNYPNPFNPETTISYTLPRADRIELAIYSIAGQKVRTLISQRMDAGAHSVIWDGRDDSGKPVSSGMYIALLRAGKQTASRRMTLVK